MENNQVQSFFSRRLRSGSVNKYRFAIIFLSILIMERSNSYYPGGNKFGYYLSH